MLKLVKTIGGHSGSPYACNACGHTAFTKAGIAWNCEQCGVYFPADLSTPDSLTRMKTNLKALEKFHNNFKRSLDELERIVKE